MIWTTYYWNDKLKEALWRAPPAILNAGGFLLAVFIVIIFDNKKTYHCLYIWQGLLPLYLTFIELQQQEVNVRHPLYLSLYLTSIIQSLCHYIWQTLIYNIVTISDIITIYTMSLYLTSLLFILNVIWL